MIRTGLRLLLSRMAEYSASFSERKGDGAHPRAHELASSIVL